MLWYYNIFVFPTGSSVGAALTFPMCGFIIDKWGWELVFYVSGILGTLWYAGWLYFVYDSPEEHPRISEKEKQYISKCLGESVSKKNVSRTGLKYTLLEVEFQKKNWRYSLRYDQLSRFELGR